MTIFQELKKKWNIKIVLTISFICIMYYFLFLDFNVRHYPILQHGTEVSYLVHELSARYGTSVSPWQMELFVAEYWEFIIASIDEILQTYPIFEEAEIYTFYDLWDLHQRLWYSSIYVEQQAYNIIFYGEYRHIGNLLHALMDIEIAWYNATVSGYLGFSSDLEHWFQALFHNIQNSAEPYDFIEANLNSVLIEIDTIIRTSPLFFENNIYNFQEFQEFRTGIVYKPQDIGLIIQMDIYLSRPQQNYILRKIDELERIKQLYVNSETTDYFLSTLSERHHMIPTIYISDRGQQRIQTILEDSEYFNIFHEMSLFNTTLFFNRLATLSLIVFIVATYFFMPSTMRNIKTSQKNKDNLFSVALTKISIAVFFALLMVIILLGIFISIYSITGILHFWNHGLMSFLQTSTLFLFNFTLGGYFAALISMLLILGIGASFITVAISLTSYSRVFTYVKFIISFVILSFIYSIVLNNAFTEQNWLFQHTNILGIEIFITLLFFICALIFTIYSQSKIILSSKKESFQSKVK